MKVLLRGPLLGPPRPYSNEGSLLEFKDGKALIKEIVERYLRELYEYNSKLPKGVLLKPVHYVKSKGRKYVYFGRYFYKYETKGGKVRWKYLGKQPPEGCPPPPPNPLEGVRFEVRGNYVLVDERSLKANPTLRRILKRYLAERAVGEVS